METKNIAMVCKLMPYYRLGVFQKLTTYKEPFKFSFFGDTNEQGGIKQIPFGEYSKEKIRWIKTKNYFYKPERLLWQTGIISEIFKSNFQAFVFEGAIGHYPIWLFAFLCKLNGKKVLYWTHGNRGLDKGVKKLLRILFFKWLGDALLLYGDHQRKIMIKDNYKPNNLFVIYNSLQPSKQFEILSKIDLDSLKLKKESLFKEPNNFTFIFIGRLEANKGLIEILMAVSELTKENIHINCIFIGNGSEKNKMNSFIQKNKIVNQVYFAGEIYEEKELAPYFAMSDLMVSPGNVGLNCLHALAYGVPVITHNDFKYQGPEVEAITNNITGAFFERNNFKQMLLKIKQWVKNNPDKNTIKLNCQKIIKEKYNPDNQSECIIEALNQVFNNG